MFKPPKYRQRLRKGGSLAFIMCAYRFTVAGSGPLRLKLSGIVPVLHMQLGHIKAFIPSSICSALIMCA
jgi:hypothetical protein